MSLAQEWMDRGEAKGLQKGIQQGIQQGFLKGEANTLLRQIERKFGAQAKAHHEKQVEQASEAELEQWLDRILTAENVGQVFGDDSSRQ
ncbi:MULTISPECIES: hypothetical protein [unclassified Ectothiorhodospira]|uniref:hypothetical protein n=1 Tax=unclassified Ectothiorhodospira TaxID=2684909 RepID=UPI001EE8E2A7|nr:MULTISPECIES: hypothetical protein [unclassified Ectothiorhodospira]MCG5516405.1 hypothetical protein [Ectothiorhodospira sp. 9100]MCG5519345.1 hypothetical protein [Ectothiorhodospira sp. 9905]